MVVFGAWAVSAFSNLASRKKEEEEEEEEEEEDRVRGYEAWRARPRPEHAAAKLGARAAPPQASNETCLKKRNSIERLHHSKTKADSRGPPPALYQPGLAAKYPRDGGGKRRHEGPSVLTLESPRGANIPTTREEEEGGGGGEGGGRMMRGRRRRRVPDQFSSSFRLRSWRLLSSQR